MIPLFLALSLFTAQADLPWVADVDGAKITLEEFNSYYYSRNQALSGDDLSRDDIDRLARDPEETQKNPFLVRTIFLDQIIRQRLVFTRAQKEGVTAQDEYLTQQELLRESLLNAFYVKAKLGDRLKVSLKEIADSYAENIARFEGASPFEAMNYIEKNLSQKKQRDEMSALLSRLMREASVVKNGDLLAKLSDADMQKRPSSGWVAKIYGKEISAKDFSSSYYAYLMAQFNPASREDIDAYASDAQMVSANPLLVKSRFLDELIAQKLIWMLAEKEKFKYTDDMNAALRMHIESECILYYVRVTYAKDLVPTAAEIDEFYEENRERLAAFPADKAEVLIRQTLKSRKLTLKAESLTSDLENGAVIKRNLELLIGDAEKSGDAAAKDPVTDTK
jgi:hypothetical protein